MLGKEPVVRDIGVEGADEVVPIVPRVGDGVVAFVPAGFRVAHQVHPMPRPPFPEMR